MSDGETTQRRVAVKLLLDDTQNGKYIKTHELRFELPVPDELGDGVSWQMTWPAAGKAVANQGDVTVRWSGEPFCANFRASAKAIQTALTEGREMVATMELPMVVEQRTGKEILRDADGRVQGVTEARFVELRWGNGRFRCGVRPGIPFHQLSLSTKGVGKAAATTSARVGPPGSRRRAPDSNEKAGQRR